MGEGFRHIDAYKNNPEFDPVILCHIVRDSCVKRQKEYGLSDDIGDIFMAESEYAHNFRGMDHSPKVNWRKDARRDRDPLLGGRMSCSGPGPLGSQ